MGLCSNIEDHDWSLSSKKYCPQFNSTHFLYGGFYSTKYAWMRLVLHFCDDTQKAEELRKKQGKTYVKCKNKEEIKDYFAKNIIGLDANTDSPTLGRSKINDVDH